VLGAMKTISTTVPAVSSSGLTPAILEVVKRRLRHQGGYYYLFVHPRQFYALKVATARNEYKHKRWLIRHNRWLEKQGRPPICYSKGEVGHFACSVWEQFPHRNQET
jgi:hypothetical protein